MIDSSEIGKPVVVKRNDKLMYGRIVDYVEGADTQEGLTSQVRFATPHGSSFDTGIFYLTEPDESDLAKITEYEEQAEAEGKELYDGLLDTDSEEKENTTESTPRKNMVSTLVDAIVASTVEMYNSPPSGVKSETEQKYSIGEKVKVSGWTGTTTGTVEDIQWVYHRRLHEHNWGYRIDYDNEDAGLTLIYVPEGYLRKLEDKLSEE